MDNIGLIKKLREETGVSISECKKAIEEAKGDIEAAKEVLRKWGKTLAGKKSERKTSCGIIEAYIHSDKKSGAMIELRCETDFVAKSDNFKNLARELCLQITAMNPVYVRPEDIPVEVLEKEKEICRGQMKDLKKPAQIMESILEGKLKKFKDGVCLLSQSWIKDDAKNVKDLVDDYVAKIGENIIVKRFVRFEI